MNGLGVGTVNDGIWPVGSTYAYGDGLLVRVDDVRPYEEEDLERRGALRPGDELVALTLYVTNGSQRSVDLGGLGVRVRSGPYGKEARELDGPGSARSDHALEGSLRPGRTVSATWAYSVQAGTGAELEIEFRARGDADRPSVTFSTLSAYRPGTAPTDPRTMVFTEPLVAAPAPPPTGRPGTAHEPAPAPRAEYAALDARRVQQIFRFLAEAEETRARPVRTLDSAAGAVWFDELPADGGVSVMTEGEVTDELGASAWLRVHRPEREDAPQPHPELLPWIDESRVLDFDQPRPPHLRRRIDPALPDHARGIPLDKAYPVLAVHPRRERIERRYAAWEAEWSAWAARRRAADPLVRLYDRLHKMHEDAVDLGETYELVLGIGRLTWRSPDGQRVERHLVTHRATLHLDPASGTLTAAPDPGAAGLLLEEGMLDGEQRVHGEVREEMNRALEGAADATLPAHLDAVHAALRSWSNAAHAAGSYRPGPERAATRAPDVPLVCFAPALLLRERNRRSTLDALKAIAGHVERGAAPTELLAYVAGRGGALTAADLAGGGTAARSEVFFALPANAEQRTIAERLRDNRLVVVQGPPGTGKTHTIANLVTDLLAQGKRVLITSHTPRALRVLRDKLPPTVRDLCVSRTEDGAAAQRELEASVHTILHRYAGYDPVASRREIDALQARLDAARTDQRRMLRDLAELRELETRRFSAGTGDYEGSLQEIAARLAAEAAAFDWLGPVPAEEPALDAAAALRLLHTIRGFTAHHRALAAEVPEASDLPTPGSFEAAVGKVAEAEAAHTQAARDATAQVYDDAVRSLTDHDRRALTTALDGYAAARVRAQAPAAATGPWAAAALTEAAAGQDWQLRARHAAVTDALRAVEQSIGVLGTSLVTGLEVHEPGTALGLATQLHDGLRQGQRLRGAFGSRTRLAKAVGSFPDTVRVDGRAPEDTAAAAVVLARAQLEQRLAHVEREWGDPAGPWQGHGPRIARLRQDVEVSNALFGLVAARTEVLAAAATAPGLAAAPWHEPGTEHAVRALLRVADTLRAAEDARRHIAGAEELLRSWRDRPDTSPAVARAHDAVRARDTDAYREFAGELAEVREAVRLRSAHRSARDEVGGAFPELARRIEDAPHDPAWEERLPLLAEAWAWTVWRDRLEQLTDPDAERRLTARLTEADDEARITLSRLAAARAWHRCLGLLTGDQSRALAAYQQAVRRIKGKYQHRYRRDAQEALREAQDAVPAWIMPLHQVAETVPMDRPGIFDVVIVDEASQSGLEAMLLSWLADRMVVVGDSKQVSPSNVGLKQDEYFQLRDRLLTALPPSVRSFFGPETSFFDLTEALSAGRGTLMLKEHFRCMPEIISFSDELCYDGRLQPLRQYGTDRLPPVRTVLVPDGEAVGTAQRLVNHAEARALADAVAAACENPAYARATMGVISLRSSKAHLTELENLIAERVGYEDREERRIRVGDAEDFQGDERDVMFVSCLNSATTAAGTVPGGFTGKAYEQRINVAASRARDQVWVFHSAPVERFHENDLRRRWLDHLGRPAEEELPTVDGEVLPDVRHEQFDGLFQQQVYLELTRRGYRVRPGYRVGRHSLDLVVEGGTHRLAVACDGDTYADGEDAGSAAAVQRDLERVDWVFVRVRASRFRWDREQALAPVWTALQGLGIEPAGPEPTWGGVRFGTAIPGDDTWLGSVPVVPAGAGLPGPVPAPRSVPAAPGAEPSSESTGLDALAAPAHSGARVHPGVPAQPAPSAAPRTPAGDRPVPPAQAPAAPVRPAPAATAAESGVFPVREVPFGVYQRVLLEMQLLQSALDAPDEMPPAAEPGQLVFLRRTLADRRERRRQHLVALRAFADEVSVGDPPLDKVVPGAVVELDFDGVPDTDTRYVVAEIGSADDDVVSPQLPLGKALLWQTVGSEITYATDGRSRTVRIRALHD
ncbi:AAA domain-containing protein [Streptomyces sp. NPDC060194]|uniref:AAA domain-containing protein n=1 Tax=Streptomyces sp. NPDC060194 TaxID=3347069 RepID=UPI003653DED0